jgi:predicted Zn finger-like uncharacterized protein
MIKQTMILECSECRTRYLVPDTAIGPDGRTVRCASCRHSWFQEPLVLDLVNRADASRQAEAARARRSDAASPIARPDDNPPRATAQNAQGQNYPGQDYDAFAHEPPFRPRRNPARRWTVAAIAAGLAMLVGVGGILWSGAPSLATEFGLIGNVQAIPLKIEQYPIERRDLDNGSELFAVGGRIVNPTNSRQPVPEIRAELRDAQGRIVYSWTITPEKRVLGPGGSVEYHNAQLDVPSSSKRLDFSFSTAAVG